jgi:hypothetical protein
MKNQNQPAENRPGSNRGNNRKRFSKPRPPRNFWKSLLTNKLFDLFIVITGVSIAFYLNSLKLAADQRQLEKYYVKNLLIDLEKDIEELKKVSLELRADYQHVVSYVEKYNSGVMIDDSLASVITEILSLDIFERNNNTYTSLLTSNGLNALGEASIRSQIASYYNQYNSIERFESVYTKVLFEVNLYFSPYCDYTRRKLTDKSVLTKTQTKNNLLIAAEQLEGGIENYEEMLTKAELLKKSLQTYLH